LFIETVKACQEFFSLQLSSDEWFKRIKKLEVKFYGSSSLPTKL